MSSSKLISHVSNSRRTIDWGIRKQHSSAFLRQPRTLPPEHLKSLNKLSNTLIDRQTTPLNRQLIQTRSLRGEERLLEQDVRGYGLRRTPSSEQIQFGSDGSFNDLYEDSLQFPDSSILPGTFVEVRRNNVVSHGITLVDSYLDGLWMWMTMVSSGEIWLHKKEDVMFDLPSIVPQDLAARCGTDRHSENNNEVNARVELLRRIRQVELALGEVQNALGRRMSSLYLQVRSSNPDAWAQITVAEVAKVIAPDEPLDLLTRFAIHKHIMERSKEFVADPLNYRISQRFSVRPQTHVDRLEKVDGFIRQVNGPIQAFATKARKIIATNRRRAKESWTEPPSEHHRNQEVFTSEDNIIIDVLRDSVRSTRQTQKDPYRIIVSKIVKTVSEYGDEVDGSSVYHLLTDLGILAPWQDIVTADHGLEQEPQESSPTIAAQNALVEKALAKRATDSAVNGEVLGPEDFYTHDLAESIRYDFGNASVYVIDDHEAEELDDGISVENIPSEPDCTWIHVHIADPTAVLPPTHIFAQQASEKLQSAYFGHRTWPMLPSSAMHALIPSLGNAASSGQPERVMSFSFKVDGSGDIVDYHVRAGIIRNVHRTTYDAVDHSLGQPRHQPTYPFGGQPPSPPIVELNKQQQADIHVLRDATDRMFKHTLQLPIFFYGGNRAEIAFSPKPLYTNRVDPLKPPIFRGFPNLTYMIQGPERFCYGARRIVSQSMTAASRIASRWAIDRGVPLLRRTSSRVPHMSDNDLADILASRNEVGCVPQVVIWSRSLIGLRGGYTLQPAMHWTLGIPEGQGYCRVTSPLRRYSDMVAHWQIKHALLNPTSSTPLFSPEWLHRLGMRLAEEERYRRNAENRYTRFWALRFIERWRQNPTQQDGSDPLAHLTGYASMPAKLNSVTRGIQTNVSIPELGLDATLSGLRGTGEWSRDFPLGQAYDVKIKKIRLMVDSNLVVSMK